MLRGETKSILHLLINCMQSADTLLICITQQKIPTEKTVDFAQFILSP